VERAREWGRNKPISTTTAAAAAAVFNAEHNFLLNKNVNPSWNAGSSQSKI
jgi:hypothetical protein